MKHARVCVGIAVYRQPLVWLREAVESVLSQTITDWILVVRVDGDEALEPDGLAWLTDQESRDSRIHIVHGHSQLGTFGSYQSLFKEVDCEFLVQLDADDRLPHQALEVALASLESEPQAPFLYSQARLIGPDGLPMELDRRSLVEWQPKIDLVQFIYFHLRLVRSTAYRQVGGYDANYFYAGDYDLSLRLSELGRPIYIPQPLYEYRLHPNSASQEKRELTHLEACRASRNAVRRRGLQEQYRLIQSPRNEAIVLELRKPRQIAVTGMHRSGTSMLSSLLARLGLDYGNDLVAADRDQPSGYFEDSQLVALHAEWFNHALYALPGGWLDWGWTPQQSVSRLGLYHWKRDAQSWLIKRQSSHLSKHGSASVHGWGWKDPRTTLLLPFWHDCCPSLKVVGIYRTPWDLSDALQRLVHPQFRLHPEMILPLWQLYNERLVEFAEAKPESCIILHAESMAKEPKSLPDILGERWDWEGLQDLDENWHENLIDSRRLRHLPGNDPIAALYAIAYPELVGILVRLQRCADLPCVDLMSFAEMKVLQNERTLNPSITVVIPTFNPTHWLLESIASVERHRSSSCIVEIVIVDDGSTNATSLLLLSRLIEAGYTVLRQKNKGLAAARNHGISHARAPLVLPLDDDNRLLSPYLTQGINIMTANESVAFLYGDRVDFGACNQLFRPGPSAMNEISRINHIDACAIVRKSLWCELGGYDESLGALEDWDFWLSAARIGANACYLPRASFEYRVREGSMLRRHLRDAHCHLDTIMYLRKKHGVNVEPLN
jgi:glycosyltransferase involved in cell wall biosynthesis